jgi:Domain of unknown function (DUF4260)
MLVNGASMNVSRLLRLEGLIIFAGAIAAYVMVQGSLLLFIVLILAPDLAMAGYLFNVRAGAAVYNLFHIYLLPGLLFTLGSAFNAPLAMQIALVWLAHIGMDRSVGYGLKYPTEFKDTHL